MGGTTAGPTRSATRTELADARLRDEILSGRLLPGDRIPVEHLAETWGLSATPVRESIRRLAGEGLVELAPQRGARVASVDHDLALEIYAIRLVLEPVALRQSLDAATSDPSFVDDVRSSFDALAGAVPGVDRLDRHRAFHLVLMSRCPNRTLLGEIASLMDRSRLFQFVATPSDPRQGHARDHRRLRDAAIAGDIDTTISVHTQHLASTLDALARARRD
ncbi:MAG: GntR family transcriptional regulator [Ilumatobacteraceae bacterium]